HPPRARPPHDKCVGLRAHLLYGRQVPAGAAPHLRRRSAPLSRGARGPLGPPRGWGAAAEHHPRAAAPGPARRRDDPRRPARAAAAPVGLADSARELRVRPDFGRKPRPRSAAAGAPRPGVAGGAVITGDYTRSYTMR